MSKLPQADADAAWIELRLDARRDTRMLVQRNVNGHVHVTLGVHGKAIIILHPHAAKRLIANVQSVLDGEDMAHA